MIGKWESSSINQTLKSPVVAKKSTINFSAARSTTKTVLQCVNYSSSKLVHEFPRLARQVAIRRSFQRLRTLEVSEICFAVIKMPKDVFASLRVIFRCFLKHRQNCVLKTAPRVQCPRQDER